MRTRRLIPALLAVLLLSTPIASAGMAKKDTSKSPKKAATASKKGGKPSAKARKGSWRKRGQQSINNERTREIQTALIREGYLSGEPSGVMDTRTKAALVRLQQENGWQTKIVPDSRALIKLGLGPDHTEILNPNTAAIATPSGRAGGITGENGRPRR